MTIHWCGTGLSAIPGLRELIQTGQPVTVWNRTVEKAQDAVGDLTQDIKPFEPSTIEAALQPGDVIVSINSIHMNSMDDLIGFLALNTAPGDDIVVGVLRNGVEIAIPLTLGARPQVS